MSDQDWIAHALKLAKRAADEDEVPVGAVVVLDDKIIGEGWNKPISQHDPTAHAEIQAIRAAAKTVGNYRLLNTTLYVTLEPCVMCVGAIVHSRIKRVVFGADDSKAGAIRGAIALQNVAKFNQTFAWQGGVLEEQCGGILTSFFERKRQKKQKAKAISDSHA